MSYWVPMVDKNSINCFEKWDQAFRVYLDVYSGQYPEWTTELIQYGHIIQTASYSYQWENVYLYDREFRKHMERFPSRSWGVILQQAWTMFLKDRLNSTPQTSKANGVGNNSGQRKPGARRKLCYPFNDGNCHYGARWKFNHRCSFCDKFGHGAYNCRKAQAVANKRKNLTSQDGGKEQSDKRQ